MNRVNKTSCGNVSFRQLTSAAAFIGIFLGIFITPQQAGWSHPEDRSVEQGNMQQVTLGSGCFWCTEAVFEVMDGIEDAESGYSNGQVDNPTYKQVCTGATGHAEVVRLTYDPQVISFEKILEIFWKTHDPTTLNRQGADIGTQYRSGVYYHTDEQRQLAEAYRDKLNASGAFNAPIVTEIVPIKNYYPAEDYHQDYYANNPRQGYCRAVIGPKMRKIRRVFADGLKER